jgi:hypothetical protein
MIKVEEAIETRVRAIRAGHLRTRGRPGEQDETMAARGYLPASVAAAVVQRHISRLYAAHKRGTLCLWREGGYWYVRGDDLARWAQRTRKGGGTDAN